MLRTLSAPACPFPADAEASADAPHPASGSPLLPDVGIVAMVPDRWNRAWQPRHHVMSRLARYFTVVWMNPAPHWRDVPRLAPSGFPAPPGMSIYEADPWLRRINRPAALSSFLLKARVQRARHILEARGARRFVLYVWRPEFAGAFDAGGFELMCYHIDDEYTFSAVDEPIRPAERRLLLHADQVFIHSRALMEKKGHLNPRTCRVPNGVDWPAFAGPGPLPDDLAAIPGPRIGYAGFIKDRLDWRLIGDVAAARPRWSLVFVGADKVRDPENRRRLDALRQRPNVYFLGEKSTDELALYPRHFDVCAMPYVCDDYTRYIFPLKLHEYLASGRPVVGTPIDALMEYSSVVAIARSAREWVTTIDDALLNDSPARAEARVAIAARHDWNILTRQIAGTIAERLGLASRLPTLRAPVPRAVQRIA